MNNTLYELIRGRVSSVHLEHILGGSLYRGLINYHKYLGEIKFDFAELLLKSLGSNALFDKAFQEFIIFNVLGDSLIVELALLLKIRGTSSFKLREEIIVKSSPKTGHALIKLLDLNEDDFIEQENVENSFSEEIIISPNPNQFLSLHDYQKRIKDEIVKNLIEIPQGRMLVHMPTGSGKTKTCVEAIIDFLRTRPFDEGLVIWFAHSNELCSQSYNTLVNTWKLKGDYPLPVFKIFGEHDAIDDILKYRKAVLFIGFQKFHALLKSKKDSSMKIRIHLSTNAKLVVIDEAHKTLAQTYRSAIEYVSTMPDCRVIGLTATPGRSSIIDDPRNTVLSDFFDDRLISIKNDDGVEVANPLNYLQERSVLAKIDHEPIEVKLTNFSESELIEIARSGELDQTHIDKIVESPIRNKIIIDEIHKALQDESRNLILVFAGNTNHCVLIQKLLEFQGITSEVVLAGTPSNLREKYISDFKIGKLKVLINFGVLTTGFDAPKLKTLVIARHTDSMILYSQMIGRALRGPLNGGNERNYIVDLVDNIASLGNPEFLFTYWEEFWGRKFKTLN